MNDNQVREIRKELRKQRLMLEKLILIVGGKEWGGEYLQGLERDANFDRFIDPIGLYELGIPERGRKALNRANLCTLDEVADRGRDAIEAIPEVGPATIRAIETALGDRGMQWAGAEAVAA